MYLLLTYWSQRQLSPASTSHGDWTGAGGSGSAFQACHGGMASTPEANEIYYIGIIDVLQLYNTGKKMETFFKGFTNDRYADGCCCEG